VFVADGDGPARFVPIPAPDDEDVAEILLRVVRRTAKVLAGFDEDLDSEADALAALQAAEVERRLRHPEPFRPPRSGAFLEGFSLHAGVRIHANDRDGRERICRYVLRPPLALHRLSRGEDGRLLYRMKRPRGGSAWLALTEDELLERLATLVPPPRVHSVRYHGVFAPHARLRSRVVPSGGAHPDTPPPPVPAPPPGARCVKDPPPRTHRVPWADLLKKVFSLDVLACPECAGRLRLIAFIAEPAVATTILVHLGLDSTGPPLAPARRGLDPVDPAPDYDQPDPVLS